MYYDSCLTLSSLASGYLLSTLNIFNPPGSIRAWRQEGRPTHPVQKGSHRSCKASSIPAFSRRGMAQSGRDARAGVRQGFPNQTGSKFMKERVRKAQDKEFGGDKNAEVWTGVRLGEKNLTADSTIPSPQAISFLTRAWRASSDDTRQSHWPKSSHFRVSQATGDYIMVGRQA